MKLDARKQPFFSDSKPACALRGHWVSFCLVDELGIGAVYGGLPYTIHDSAGQMHKGRLDKNGFARLQDIYCGPVVIAFDDLYSGTEKPYSRLVMRRTYPLPITELQIRAEQSQFANSNGQRVDNNPAKQKANRFYQVEVRDLVRRTAHLPVVAQ